MDPSAADDGRFATTRWTIVLAAGNATAAEAGEALSWLCAAYWSPLYLYVRRRGYGADEAQDLTQGFFAALLSRRDFAKADPRRGRFRAFLLTAMQHFLANEHDRRTAGKRGGGRPVQSLDVDAAEARYPHELADTLSPERLYERQWALTLLERVLEGLRAEYTHQGQAARFEALKPLLTGEPIDRTYAELGRDLGLGESAVRVAVHRMRRRYAEHLRSEIAETIGEPNLVDEEIRCLFKAVQV